MGDKLIFKIDVDDTCANLVDPWIETYNLRWSDKLEKKFITDWDIASFTLPMCGKNIFKYLNPQLYEKVQPIEGALKGVRYLRNFGRVIFTTSFIPSIAGVKYKWLCDHGFMDDKSNYYEAYDKNLIFGDVLIDDGYHNFNGSEKLKILYSQPWNLKFDHRPRANNWEEVIKTVKEFLN